MLKAADRVPPPQAVQAAEQAGHWAPGMHTPLVATAAKGIVDQGRGTVAVAAMEVAATGKVSCRHSHPVDSHLGLGQGVLEENILEVVAPGNHPLVAWVLAATVLAAYLHIRILRVRSLKEHAKYDAIPDALGPCTCPGRDAGGPGRESDGNCLCCQPEGGGGGGNRGLPP